MTAPEALARSRDEDMPYECCNCPLGGYNCKLVNGGRDAIPPCLGAKVRVKASGRVGEIAVVRVDDETVYFRVVMPDGVLETVPAGECELAKAVVLENSVGYKF